MTADPTRAWYQANARHYDRRHPGLAGDDAYYAALAGGRLVLELGAGTGRITEALARVAVGVIAVDYAPAMLTVAAGRLRVASNVRLLCADARRLPLAGRFNLVVLAYRVLQHLPREADREALFLAARRLLLPGGVLAFDTWHGPGVQAAPALAALAPETIRAGLVAAGFEIQQIAYGFRGETADARSFIRVWQATVPADGVNRSRPADRRA